MTISNATSITGAALLTNLQYLDLIAHNIDGAQDPNYARRELRTSSMVATNGQLLGSRVVIDRIDNAPLRAGALQADAITARENTIQNSLSLLANSVGGADDDNSLAGRVGALRKALELAADTPENTLQADAVVVNAKSVAANLRDVASAVQSARLDADKKITTEVNNLKNDLKDFQIIIADIAAIPAKGGDVTGLLDKRDTIIASINRKLPVKMHTDSQGHTTLYSTDSGAVLFDNRIANINFHSTGNVTPNDIYLPINQGAASPYIVTLSGLTIDTVDVTPFASNNHGLVNGTLGALFELRDKTLPSLQRHVDAVASSLIRTFRTADSTAGPNTDSLFTGFQTSTNDLLTQAQQLGVAMTIQVNPLFDNDVGGRATRVRDGVNATSVGPVGNATLLNSFIGALQGQTTYPTGVTGNDTQSPISATNDFHTRMQLLAANAQNSLTVAQNRSGTLNDALHNATGVNVDAQLQQLQEVQKLYAANASIVKAIGEMLDSLLQAIN